MKVGRISVDVEVFSDSFQLDIIQLQLYQGSFKTIPSLPSERYLTSGSLHSTRQDKRPHMLPVITVKLSFII